MTEFNKNKPEIGQDMCYPYDYGFQYLTRIRKNIANMWLKEINYTHTFPSGGVWLNKKAIVVDIIDEYKIIAVYNHDGHYYLMKLEF